MIILKFTLMHTKFDIFPFEGVRALAAYRKGVESVVVSKGEMLC